MYKEVTILIGGKSEQWVYLCEGLVAGPISMSTPQTNLCEWEQPKQYEGTEVR